MNVPFLDITIQNRQFSIDALKAIDSIMENCWFVGGPFVNRFEEEMEEYIGVKHAIGCGNGTDALILALRACGVGPGDEVITTAFSFFATAEAIASVGAKPVFVDILPHSYRIDTDKIEDTITSRTRAIIPVHIFGACCNMPKIMDIAKRHNLYVIEDAAQAIGSEYDSVKAGSLGDIGCFSFYPTKNLGGCGDGGMCTTDNDELATRILALREHGAGRNGAEAIRLMGLNPNMEESQEKVTAFYDPYKYFNYMIGYNSRLDSIQACILSMKLPHLEGWNRRRRSIAEMYEKGLCDKIRPPFYNNSIRSCFHQYGVRVEEKEAFIAYMADHGVGVGNFYPVPLHKQKAFNEDNCANFGAALPEAEALCSQIVCLPIYPELTDEQVQYVIDTANSFFTPEDENKHEPVYIHPTADVSKEAVVGEGTKIWNNAQIREGSVLGEDCIIGKNVYIDTQAHIGDRVKIQNNVNVYKGVILDDDTFVGPSATFTNDMFPRAFSKDWKVYPTLVKKGASIGANATIRCGVVIGEYAMIGCGSVVTKDVPDHAMVVGNPARQIGWVCKCGEKVMENGVCPNCGEEISYADELHI